MGEGEGEGLVTSKLTCKVAVASGLEPDLELEQGPFFISSLFYQQGPRPPLFSSSSTLRYHPMDSRVLTGQSSLGAVTDGRPVVRASRRTVAVRPLLPPPPPAARFFETKAAFSPGTPFSLQPGAAVTPAHSLLPVCRPVLVLVVLCSCPPRSWLSPSTASPSTPPSAGPLAP